MIINRSYEDKKGVKRYVTEILVNEFLMLSPKTAATVKK